MMPDRHGAALDGIAKYGTTEEEAPPARGRGRHGKAGRGSARHGWPGRPLRRRGGRRERGAHEATRFPQPWAAGSPRPHAVLRYGNGVVALAASACLLAVLGAGLGTLPALGPALVPGHGVWTSAAGGAVPVSQALTLPGLSGLAQVSFSRPGVPVISAQTDADAYLALGYLHARFRLTQLDIERRLAEGKLAQLDGPAAVASDSFELRLGLLRTAQAEWASMPKSSPAAQALVGYSRGVNDYLAQVRASQQWPALFSVAGVYPADWTPVDSLAVQGALTQELGFSTRPLDDALLAHSLGPQAATSWFADQPPNSQRPYDPGPYRQLGLTPLPGVPLPATPLHANGSTHGGPRSRSQNRPAGATAIPAGLAQASAAILVQARELPPGQVSAVPAGNAWAANGPKVAGGGAMLAGDPHLPQTLPAGWYQVALSAPGLAVSGVSVPGLPAVLIGHNAHIAWSLTSAQSQSTLFYAEQTSAARPGEYFWRGQWRRMRALHYTIAVRGGASRQLTVDETVHGSVLAQAGQTVAVDWMGALGSPDVSALLAIGQAGNFGQFRAALAGWRSPALTFVYADDRGHIGALSAGFIPQVRQGSPWLPMPGSGADDVAGVIPLAALPQVYDPPSHVLAVADQRPVAASYPYYLGTASFFDPGYRADAEYAYLSKHSSMGPSSFASLQADLGDQLASVIVPRLIAALGDTSPKAAARPRASSRGSSRRGSSGHGSAGNGAPGQGPPLTAVQQQAAHILASWDRQMTVDSAGAAIWWTFWSDYLAAVFGPWWTAAKVPVPLDRPGLSVGPGQVSLDEDLQAWTTGQQPNAAFSPPGGPSRTAATVMRSAFAAAVADLGNTLGGGPGSWTWGKLHTTDFPSLTGAAALGYGPRPAGGDIWTIDAAEGGLNSVAGPNWRMIVRWSGAGTPIAEGIYPGGQSENPASPWYSNLVSDWWAGSYLPLPAVTAASATRTTSATGATSAAGATSALGAATAAPPTTSGTTVWEFRP
jgi:penicillin G amidase